jgi:hypothetical protein
VNSGVGTDWSGWVSDVLCALGHCLSLFHANLDLCPCYSLTMILD